MTEQHGIKIPTKEDRQIALTAEFIKVLNDDEQAVQWFLDIHAAGGQSWFILRRKLEELRLGQDLITKPVL